MKENYGEIYDFLAKNPVDTIVDMENDAPKIGMYFINHNVKDSPFHLYLEVDDRLKPFLGAFNPVLLERKIFDHSFIEKLEHFCRAIWFDPSTLEMKSVVVYGNGNYELDEGETLYECR